jgi:dipeptide/tripeptide permease
MRNTLNKEQKSAIFFLLASKTLERLAFYLLLAIFIQYLMDSLKLETYKAGSYYGVFLGTIGLTTLFSGLLGDLRDRMKIVKIGFILLIVMYLAIVFLPNINFVVKGALIILGLGIGLISPNIIVFLGNIYNEKENEIIGLPGFIMFSITINLGALIAPLLSVFLKDNFGYNSIFVFASLFGLLSFIVFLKFKKLYNKLNLVAEQKTELVNFNAKNLNTIILVSILSIGVLIRFALNQNGFTFNFASRDLLDYDINQTLNNIEKYLTIISQLFLAIIVTRIKLNWEKIFNLIIIGLILSTIAFVLIAGFKSLSQVINGKNIFIQSYVLLIVAETLIYPPILYSIYRCSPIKFKGLLQGISFFLIAIFNYFVGVGLDLYEINASMAFIGFALALLISAILIVILKKIVNNKLKEIY